ncbi:MAG: YjbH domain-containing protein [Thiogranum sp.]
MSAFQTPVAAEPSSTGQSGLINMPDARVEQDGTLRFGTSYFKPYLPIWSSITLLPRLELSGRYTIIRGLSSGLGKGFGDFKDKAFDVKALLLREGGWLPGFAVGSQDFTGTGVFSAKYGVLSKRLGGTDYTLGYGSDRIDGPFGGVRQQVPWIRNLSLVVEYDANDYKNDFRADESGADKRDGGWTYGVEYKLGWLGAQLATDGDDVGVNTWVSIPLEKKEFVPKIHEPAPYTKKTPKASIDRWMADTGYAARLAHALYERDYKNIRLGFNGHTLSASLTNTRISLIGRAVGRAARIMLALGPAGTKALRITYTDKGLPTLSYYFSDTRKLQRYFDGLISRAQLDHYLEITYAEPASAEMFSSAALDVPADEQLALYEGIERTDEGHFLSFRRDGRNLSSFQIVPFNVSLFFNDPNGAARYNLYTAINYTQQVGTGLFFDSGVQVTLDEDVSKVSQPSNSRLPHVRTDIARYLQGGGRVKLTKLLANQYFQPRKRVYARASAGIYEMMFAGAGGQVLYLPERGNWATDLTVDWLRQRSTDDMFEFRDYDTVTAIGALHYRLPSWGLTATVRAGRFLARDKGARFELQRRFRSGITLGGWYTLTDGNDKTPPGSPGDPYFDKGIFASIPLGSMLTRDTQSRAEMSIRPWTRDVGQMVVSPGDLYTLFERTLMLDNVDYGVGSRLGQ